MQDSDQPFDLLAAADELLARQEAAGKPESYPRVGADCLPCIVADWDGDSDYYA